MALDICCWDDRNWNALIYSIHSQKCILLLGPDAALEPIVHDRHLPDEGGLLKPLSEILANELARDIGEDITKLNIDPNDLPQVSQYYVIQNSPLELALKAKFFFTARQAITSTMHRNLAMLSFYLIITTTFDKMMINAYEDLLSAWKKPRIDFHNFKGPKRDRVQMGTVEKPLIYQLYGSPDELDSLVMTENDFLDFLIRVASGAAPVPANILSELTDEHKCLLFLGFGFRHWYLRVLLHVLNIGSKKNPSFALERIEPNCLEEIKRATLFIKHKGSKIQICDVKLDDFVAELARRYNDEYGKNELPETRDAPPEFLRGPRVFISYVRENEADIRRLRDKLQEKQINALIDYDFIEIGDSWSERIDQFISEFDYFILALSRDLVNQPEAYVYQELELARRRQSRLRPGLKFILPVKIDDCDIPHYLSDLHVDVIDLHDSDGVEKIVKAINRDFQLRER